MYYIHSYYRSDPYTTMADIPIYVNMKPLPKNPPLAKSPITTAHDIT